MIRCVGARPSRFLAALLLAALAVSLPARTASLEGATGPEYAIRVHAIRTADDDGTLETVISPEQVKRWVEKTNAVLAAANAGIRLEFDPTPTGPDWGTVLPNTRLNHMANGDAAAAAEANRVAARYPGKLVVFFRYAAGSGAAANRGNGFANTTTSFIALPAFEETTVVSNVDRAGKVTASEQRVQNIWQMAHDFGHYLGLGHTFPGSSDALTDTPAKAAAYIRDNGGTRAALDGDGIADTPAEAGTSFFVNQGWALCAGHDSYAVSGRRTDGTAFTYTYNPARNNIMSYFACEPMGFTPGQVRAMRRSLLTEARKHLIEQPCFPDFHGLRADRFQTCFDYWVGRGFWPVTLSTYAVSGGTYVAGSFQRGANRPVYVLMTPSDFQGKFEAFRGEGFRPDQVSVVGTGGGVRFTAIWARIDGPFESWVGLTRGEYQAKWDHLRAAGYAHVDLAVYQDNGLKFTGVWVKRPFSDYLTRLSLSSEEYTVLFNRYFPQGYRPTRFTAYMDGPARRYAVIMEKRPGTWAHDRDMSPEAYQARYNHFAAQGLRLYHLSVLGNAISAIWHKP